MVELKTDAVKTPLIVHSMNSIKFICEKWLNTDESESIIFMFKKQPFYSTTLEDPLLLNINSMVF
jgi:hypothetical protein